MARFSILKWFRSGSPNRHTPVRRPKSFRPSLEALEDRYLMASNLNIGSMAFSLHDDGTFVEDSGPSQGLKASNVNAIAPGTCSDGSTPLVAMLQAGGDLLYTVGGGTGVLAHGVVAMAPAMHDGLPAVAFLLSDGSGHVYGDTGYTALDATIMNVARSTATNGQPILAFLQNNGDLLYNAGSGNGVLDHNVRSLAQMGGGAAPSVAWLGNDSTLHYYTGGNYGIMANNVQQVIPGTADTAGDAGIYFLQQGGYLFLNAGSGNIPLANNVLQVVPRTADAAGHTGVYFLQQGGNLSVNPGSGNVLLGTGGIVAADGSIWFLGTVSMDGAGDQAIYQLSNGQMNTVCVTTAAIGSQWLGMGGPTAALGLPVTNAITQNGQLVQLFQQGALSQSPDGHVWLILPPPANVAQVGVVAVDLSGNTNYLVIPNASTLVPTVNDPAAVAQVGVVAVTGVGDVTTNFGGTIVNNGSSSSPTNAGDVINAIAQVVRDTYHMADPGFLGTIAGAF
jgi:hypothetical protein